MSLLPLIDTLRSAWDNFLKNRFQSAPVSRGQTYRVFKMEPQKPARAIPLFGSDPEDPFGFGYSAIRSTHPQGPGTTQPLQSEMKSVDDDIERWRGPDLSVPSMIPHGKRLDYSRGTDQEPIHSFSGTIDEKWDGQVRNITKKPDFQSARSRKEPTAADLAEKDLKNLGYDFSV